MAGDWRNSFQVKDPRRERRSSSGDGVPCARAEHCAEAARVIGDDGQARRVPPSGPLPFCVTDQGLIERCIRNAPRVYFTLIPFLGVKVTGEEKLRIPFGPTVPIRLDVDEVARLIFDSVMTWHDRVADVDCLDADSAAWRKESIGPHAGASLPKASIVIAERMTALLSLGPEWMLRPSRSPAAQLASGVEGDQAWTEHGGQWYFLGAGVHAGTEFLRLDYLARAVMGLTPAPVTRLLGVECANEQCSQRALRLADPPQHDGDTAYHSQCQACRHLMTWDEYHLWARRNLRWLSTRLTPAQIAARSGAPEEGGVTEDAVNRLIAATQDARVAAVASG